MRIMNKCQHTPEQVYKIMFFENTASDITDSVMHVKMCHLIMVLLTMKNKVQAAVTTFHFLYLKAC